MSIYELARQRILEHAEKGAKKKREKSMSPSDRHERRHMRYAKWYSDPENKDKALKAASTTQQQYKDYYGFFPSALSYYRKKIRNGEMTAGQIPDKFKVAWSDYKNGRKPWRE